jgi:NADH:ubiquinone reductase (H+-translocating)
MRCSHAGKELKGEKVKRPFRYLGKGNMAVVGKNYAVLERDWLRTSGLLTWLVWAFVHILSLPQLQNRLRVQTSGSGRISPASADRA